MSEPTPKMSLAGEEVLIFDGPEFAELAGYEFDSHSFKLSMQMPRSRLAVLKALWRHGKITDRSGFAVGHLAERVREFEQLSFNPNAVLTAPLMQACVERVTNGRRTMSIALVALPQQWLRLVEGPLSDDPPEPMVDAPQMGQLQLPEPGPALIDVYQPPAPEPPGPMPVEYEVAGAVATSLMAQVVEIISHNGSNVLAVKNAQLREENIALGRRLGEQVAYVDRLRRDLRQAQDELVAAKLERDGLRQRAQAAEHNLKVATSADAQKLIDAEVRKEVDKLMRQRPGTTHGAA